MKYTNQELYDFVARADTIKKVRLAEKWIHEHVDDNELYDDLMMALSFMSRELYRLEEGRPSLLVSVQHNE